MRENFAAITCLSFRPYRTIVPLRGSLKSVSFDSMDSAQARFRFGYLSIFVVVGTSNQPKFHGLKKALDRNPLANRKKLQM